MKAVDPDSEGTSLPAFRRLLKEKMDSVGIDHKFAGRYLNEGFSGGEKKRAEVLPMATLRSAKFAILDARNGLRLEMLMRCARWQRVSNKIGRSPAWVCWSLHTIDAS
jgi:Fe-S cluster assembly ATP-binding protein